MNGYLCLNETCQENIIEQIGDGKCNDDLLNNPWCNWDGGL